jgi:hypothetical protein
MVEIEVLPAELQAANFVARNAEILSVNLKRSLFQFIEPDARLAEDLREVDYLLRWKTEPHSSPQAGRLIATAGLFVEVKPPKLKKTKIDGGKGVAIVELLYEVQYLVPAAPVPKGIANINGIEAFCKWNALYNCWPFFREEVRRICVQAGLPPLTLPLLKLGAKTPQTAKTAVTSES